MPGVQTLDELMAHITAFIGDDAESRDRAISLGKALKRTDATKPAVEALKKLGANERQGEVVKAQGTIAELQGRVAQLTEQVEEKEATIQQLQSQAPDFTRRLNESEAKYQQRIKKLEEERDSERAARRTDNLETYHERFLGLLLPQLADDDYARYTALPKYAQFIKADPDDPKKVVVVDPEDGTPYDPERGDPLKQLLADALDAIPGKYKAIPRTEPGAGSDTRQQAGPQRARTVEEVKELRKQSGIYAM